MNSTSQHPDSITLSQRLMLYVELTRLNKPVGILLLLWPTLWALWAAAEGVPDLHVLTVFITGVVLMRSAGCIINDYADRNIDKHVQRTRNRPLTSGRISSREALILFALLCVMAFALVLTLNHLTIYLSFGALALAMVYPFMKRYTHLPQVVLGAAFGWAIPMAFAAQTGSVPHLAWLLFMANVLWSTAYDTMYAMVDREDDLKIGVRSTAILFAEQDRLIIAILQGLVILALALAGSQLDRGVWFFMGLGLASGFVTYQLYLIRDRQPVACFKAFLNNSWFGAVVFAGFVLDYAITGAR
ncbi:MAG TPA: 4-hydroxybenzoate octaprenyltransferase [Gammaproteobacteria bacterium]|nr:4-hydroxybenzoate octaprenyltransferase [Gammaproteobacteria bacterium]